MYSVTKKALLNREGVLERLVKGVCVYVIERERRSHKTKICDAAFKL